MSKPNSTGFVAMSFEDWCDAFKPQANTTTPNAPFDGNMFETYGDDLSAVIAANTVNGLNVWTAVENDDGDWVIVDGYHRVNRMGYFITRKPAKAGEQYDVTLD